MFQALGTLVLTVPDRTGRRQDGHASLRADYLTGRQQGIFDRSGGPGEKANRIDLNHEATDHGRREHGVAQA